MKFRLYLVTFLIFLIVPSMLFADGSESGKITQIKIRSNNRISVWLDGTNFNDDCSGGAQWTMLETDDLFKEKLSLLYMAAASDETVKLTHLSSWGCGTWTSNRIAEITVQF